MKLEELKYHLKDIKELTFRLPNGTVVPKHFHVTEVGLVSKHFIDCGGVVRKENVVNFQLWQANDFDHRLAPQKLVDIIELSEKTLELDNLEIEVEYQSETIGKYNLEFNGIDFLLTATHTDCLAKDNCGISENELISYSSDDTNSCAPGSGCC